MPLDLVKPDNEQLIPGSLGKNLYLRINI